jgi:Flp pilus assembly protein TadG
MNFKKQEGAAIVETAIILPLFLLLVFGVIEFSIALYDKAMITNASREGARAGIVFRHPTAVTDAEITAVVNNYLADRLISFDAVSTANTTVTRAGTSPGGELTVQVDYNYTFLVLPGFLLGSGSGINMTAETIMRFE